MAAPIAPATKRTNGKRREIFVEAEKPAPLFIEVLTGERRIVADSEVEKSIAGLPVKKSARG